VKPKALTKEPGERWRGAEHASKHILKRLVVGKLPLEISSSSPRFQLPKTLVIVKSGYNARLDLFRKRVVVHEPVATAHECVREFKRGERRAVDIHKEVARQALQSHGLSREDVGFDEGVRLTVDRENDAF
jgi:hypothetical protein